MRACTVADHRAHDELHRNVPPKLVHHHAFVGDFLAGRHDGRHLGHVLGRHEVQHRPAQQFVQRAAEQLAHGWVGVHQPAVLVKDDALGARFHELRQPPFRVAHRLVRQPMSADVGDEHEHAEDLALGCEVRQQVHLDPSRRAISRHQASLVGHGTGLPQHGLHIGLDLSCRRFADDLRIRAADDGLVVQSEGPRIGPVGKLAAIVARPVVGDENGHVLDHQVEQVGLLPRLCQHLLLRRVVSQQAEELAARRQPARCAARAAVLAVGMPPLQLQAEVLRLCKRVQKRQA
jgi:hypothetical protein